MNGYLRAAYREQLEMRPSLTQEEVEKLYAEEGIQDKPIIEVIKELEDEIRSLKSERDNNIKKIREAFDKDQKDKYREITSSIDALEKKKDELRRIQSELQELMGGVDVTDGMLSSITAIDSKIETLRKEWHGLASKEAEIADKKDEVYREARINIAAAERNFQKSRKILLLYLNNFILLLGE